MARLQASSRAGGGVLARYTWGGNAAQAALEGDLAGKVPAIRRTAWQPPWRGSGRRSWHETPDFPGVQQMRRNIPQS